jgi:formamidopyrimidine-DNA glycosylase
MPELPEVETVARELRPLLIGREFASARVLWPRTIAEPDPESFALRVAGQRIVDISRRGKYILSTLVSGDTLIVHLRMTGRLSVAPIDSPELAETHVRAVLYLAGGDVLVFNDARKFGRIWLVPDANSVIGKLGPEPLAWDFTPDVLASRLRTRRTSLKALLLDQTIVAGVGNIYADEALHLAGLHPLRSGAGLNDEEVTRLHAAIQNVLTDAIGERGTTLRDYRPPYSMQGAYQDHLQVYQQTDRPCPRCGAPIQRIRVTQRSTHYCPHCQPEMLPATDALRAGDV